jgi:hypothetical protein
MTETLEQSFKVNFLDPGQVRVFVNPNGLVCLEYGGTVFWKLSARRALPQQCRDEYVFLYNYNDDEIGSIRSLRDLTDESADQVNALLEKRYFTQEIRKVYSIQDKFSLLIFNVKTDTRDNTDFTVVRPKDSIYRSRRSGFIINDAESNIYHVDRNVLDDKDLIRIERYC